jgi:hypothetical protein
MKLADIPLCLFGMHTPRRTKVKGRAAFRGCVPPLRHPLRRKDHGGWVKD